jgi:hypothetical protein
MAAPSHVFTIRRAAEMLGCDEELLCGLLGQLEPEDGMMWVYDTGDEAVPVFTDLGIETLREIIRDQFGNAS